MERDKQGANHRTVRADNLSLVQRLLYTDGPLTRMDLAAKTGLSKMTITNLVQNLLGQGIVRELSDTGRCGISHDLPESEFRGLSRELPESDRRNLSHALPESDRSVSSPVTDALPVGRKPLYLDVLPDAHIALGLYIARDMAVASVFNWRMEEKARRTIRLPTSDTLTAFRQRILSCAQSVLKDSGLPASALTGIGAAVIGPIDLKQGIILNPPDFHDLREVPLKEWLEECFGVPVTMDNDMNASALAEKHFGKGRQLSDFLYVGVSNGIGTGIILGGRLYEGARGYAGEIGHTTIAIDGPRCVCGNIGCLELYASIRETVNRVKDGMAKGIPTCLTDSSDKSGLLNSLNPDGVAVLQEQRDGQEISWTDIAEAARHEDPLCLSEIRTLCGYLASGLVNAVNTFDPEAIFLGHDIALAGECIPTELAALIRPRVLAIGQKEVQISLSAFGDLSPVFGSVALVFNQFLS